MIARSTFLFIAITSTASLAIADDKSKAGTDGTVTSYDSNKAVLAVEVCDKKDGEWDYSPCLKVLRERTVGLLCKKGAGTYKWSFQVGSEKSTLSQSTTCASS